MTATRKLVDRYRGDIRCTLHWLRRLQNDLEDEPEATEEDVNSCLAAIDALIDLDERDA